MILMARAEYLLAEYFLETSPEKLEHYAAAANWAELALYLHQDYAESQTLSKLRRNSVEGLYWFATALSRWSEVEGVSTSLRYKDRIQSMMNRVIELRPDYFFGGAFRYLGAYFGHLPGLNDEELRLSKGHFERAIKLGPDFFENHVSFAEIYGKKVDNHGLVKRHLEIAARGDPRRLKDFYPEQLLEQTRARKLLKGEAP